MFPQSAKVKRPMLSTCNSSKFKFLVIALLMIVACSYTPLTLAPTPSPRPKPTSLPTPAPVWIQIGYFDDSPSPNWHYGTTIFMYRVDGKLILKSHYLDGSSRVQELIQSATQAARYDIVGEAREYYVLQDGVLGIYDGTGLIWEATCGDPYYLDALLGCQSP